LVAALGGTGVLLAAAVFAFAGPLQPGWSKRAGTSAAVLAGLGSANAGGTATSNTAQSTGSSALPDTPFTSGIDGTYALSGPSASGSEQLVFSMHLRQGAPLVVTLPGTASARGIEMTSGQVSLGTLSGPVTSLDGSTVLASVSGSGTSDSLSIDLTVNRSSRVVSGSISGTATGGRA
jgi:hypothetical protein